ncbi:MAG TPA: hypothetical protein VFC44_16440 [Candidatus Saccharimonadales bacterium]|nr:hypothetical protein [Candidatus Saccharimonadales bacterium]
MKKKLQTRFPLTLILLADLSAAALLCGGGCSTPVALQGDYQTAGQTITAGFDATTNSVTLSGQISNTNQTVGGSVTVRK